MSRKKTQLDEFSAMAKLYEILKPFPAVARDRMIDTVEHKILAEEPKPRVRRKSQQGTAHTLVKIASLARDEDRPHGAAELM